MEFGWKLMELDIGLGGMCLCCVFVFVGYFGVGVWVGYIWWDFQFGFCELVVLL